MHTLYIAHVTSHVIAPLKQYGAAQLVKNQYTDIELQNKNKKIGFQIASLEI